MSNPSASVPLWKRLNYLIMSIGGCAFGFHVQDRVMEGNITKLKEEIPKLERELEQAILRRRSLEREVERLMSSSSTTTTPNHQHHIVAASILEHEQQLHQQIPPS